MLLLIVGFIILFNICKPVNIFRGVVWGGCLTGCILCIIFLPKFIRNYGNVNEVYHVIRSILDCNRGSTAIPDTSGKRIAERISEDKA